MVSGAPWPIGLLATEAAPAGVDGLFYGGGVDQLWRQAVGAFAVLFYSLIMTLLIGFILHKTIGFRVSRGGRVDGRRRLRARRDRLRSRHARCQPARHVAFGGASARHDDDDDEPTGARANHDQEVSA